MITINYNNQSGNKNNTNRMPGISIGAKYIAYTKYTLNTFPRLINIFIIYDT